MYKKCEINFLIFSLSGKNLKYTRKSMKMQFKRIILLVYLTISLVVAIKSAKVNSIQINNGIYFKELKYMRLYESSAPIVYQATLPNGNEVIPSIEEALNFTEIYKAANNWTSDIHIRQNYEAIKLLYESLIRDFKPIQWKIVRKRSISDGINSIRDFLKDILVACCRVLTYRDRRNFLENEVSLAKQYCLVTIES